MYANTEGEVGRAYKVHKHDRDHPLTQGIKTSLNLLADAAGWDLTKERSVKEAWRRGEAPPLAERSDGTVGEARRQAAPRAFIGGRRAHRARAGGGQGRGLRLQLPHDARLPRAPGRPHDRAVESAESADDQGARAGRCTPRRRREGGARLAAQPAVDHAAPRPPGQALPRRRAASPLRPRARARVHAPRAGRRLAPGDAAHQRSGGADGELGGRREKQAVRPHHVAGPPFRPFASGRRWVVATVDAEAVRGVGGSGARGSAKIKQISAAAAPRGARKWHALKPCRTSYLLLLAWLVNGLLLLVGACWLVSAILMLRAKKVGREITPEQDALLDQYWANLWRAFGLATVTWLFVQDPIKVFLAAGHLAHYNAQHPRPRPRQVRAALPPHADLAPARGALIECTWVDRTIGWVYRCHKAMKYCPLEFEPSTAGRHRCDMAGARGAPFRDACEPRESRDVGVGVAADVGGRRVRRRNVARREHRPSQFLLPPHRRSRHAARRRGAHARPCAKLLVAGGANFTNAFVHTPICCPSRSSYLTGRYLQNSLTIQNDAYNGCGNATWAAARAAHLCRPPAGGGLRHFVRWQVPEHVRAAEQRALPNAQRAVVLHRAAGLERLARPAGNSRTTTARSRTTAPCRSTATGRSRTICPTSSSTTRDPLSRRSSGRSRACRGSPC